MIEDVYEPLARYSGEFRDRFAALTREKFKELTVSSGVDVAANRKLVSEINGLEEIARSLRLRKIIYGCLLALGFIGAAAALFGAVKLTDRPQTYCVFGVIVGIIVGVAFIPLFKDVSKRLKNTCSIISDKKKIAWKQMAGLNALYTWDMTPRLIEATVPRLEFDPYFTAERLASLHRQYGWDDSFNDDKSMLFAQSGQINGNPFAFGHYLDMDWGEKTYTGTKEISWTEWEEDANGKKRRVRRYETLHASVTKPIPVYSEQKFVVYGNDAAPNLSFSREPSGLSGDGKGLLNAIKKGWRLNRLKSHSRNLTDDSDFTLMSNHEFETWFHAKDRDNEVEFRLLFTPIAQIQMLNLMKDTTAGYGDDFAFIKQKKVNVLFSQHLNEGEINTDPSRFHNWDYDAAFRYFIEFNEKYFRDIYFSLAPLLSIPLYQQTRSHEEIWKGVVPEKPSSFWEHEAIANYHGEDCFRHPSSITRNILKTRVVKSDDGGRVVEVTAHGYQGVERIEYKNVYGGDGKWHDVPVPWTEYLPVVRTSKMSISESENPTDEFARQAKASRGCFYRRSIYSFVK